MQNVGLQSDQTGQLAETFGLLADPTRLSIVVVCMEREIPAGDIADELGLSASLVSHHLRLLRAARMLRAERRGKQVFYSMADACVRDVLKIMINHLFIHEHGGSDEPHEGED
ncbi:MAG: metalloregulator ArsR/SmtB family transcription factor [Alphaproteobacteria bacterium]|nr:metalloregulator ArsR/SmtB family transcription factor [Alphaproteobacteria bacterium]